uniref:Uncharacterized protein n=1 Tax=Ditylenchus dipsaci TaxID=166011 RepID=A0A915CML6_9BILA
MLPDADLAVIEAVAAKLTEKRRLLSLKFQNDQPLCAKAFLVDLKTLEAQQLKLLLTIESKLEEELILSTHNELGCADRHLKPTHWPMLNEDEIFKQLELSKNMHCYNLSVLLSVEMAKTLPITRADGYDNKQGLLTTGKIYITGFNVTRHDLRDCLTRASASWAHSRISSSCLYRETLMLRELFVEITF